MNSFSSPVFGVKLGVNWQVKSFSSPVLEWSYWQVKSFSSPVLEWSYWQVKLFSSPVFGVELIVK